MNELRVVSAGKPQRRASDPAVSAWVSANAGSGKTEVLVHRVIRLLLAGTPPERILCLTFTRAAAAEMSNRLFRDLGAWVVLDDRSLLEQIRTLCGHEADPELLSRARRLFAAALDAPGGLKIQTIHGFCERLLQRFPVEAGVVPGFKVLDEASATELLAAASRLVLNIDLAEDADRALLSTIVRYAGAQQFDELVKELLKQPRLLTSIADAAEHRQALESLLQVPSDTTPQAVCQRAFADVDRRAYLDAANALQALGNNSARLAQSIRVAMQETSLEKAFGNLRNICLTREGDERKYFPPAQLSKIDSRAAAFLQSELNRLLPLFEEYRAAVIVEATVALLQLAGRIIQNYARAKDALSSYDYDDLIFKTLALFQSLTHRGWVLYKLDGGIDHLLIDEAQDTSKEQWQIIQSLTEDFFSGSGARGAMVRTIFAVGDEKQSIFSFQGGDPEEFHAMQDYFAKKISALGARLEEVPLTLSFRSTAAVLEAVDAVFTNETHQASRIGASGLVEVWPLEEGHDRPERDPWRAPLDYVLTDHPRRRLAKRIARTIRRWIDEERILPSRGRAIRPSDILILVRTRTTLMDEIVRALKLEDLPVAGADRLELAAHIAVMDLIALGHFVLLPADDHMLACVLKSPLVERDDGLGIDDEDLFDLAHGRGQTPLWRRLQHAADSGKPYRRAASRLACFIEDAASKPPYEFFSSVLNEHEGLPRIIARLGNEAVEPVSEFLSRCLDYDAEHAPSLTGFLAWLAGQGAIIKRDMDLGSGEIRVMTVHGAKGLQSNIVILPDTCTVPDKALLPKIFLSPVRSDGELLQVPVWRIKADRDHPVLAALREEQFERENAEYVRLLYVAMTRAADHLYICGSTSRDLPEGCWYRRIMQALAAKNLGKQYLDEEGRTIWRHEHSQEPSASERDSQHTLPPSDLASLPAWATTKANVEQRPFPWLAPSRAGEIIALNRERAEQIVSPLALPTDGSFVRGALIHRLLQSLPDLPAELREERARAYLRLKAHALSIAEQQEIAETVMLVLNDPAFHAVFSLDAMAEVPVAARVTLPGGRVVPILGRIDRLVLESREILILDFKTNRPVPDSPAEVDPAYIRQLTLYRLVMKDLFPNRAVRAALLWTDGPKLMELPSSLMEKELG
jgi:ATP-dependent helicase/nuclease subunit A